MEVFSESLLDVLIQRRGESSASRKSISRTIVIGTHRSLKLSSIQSMIQSVIHPSATGLVIVQDSSVILYLESSSDDSIHALSQLKRQKELHNLCILCSNDNCEKQCFKDFYGIQLSGTKPVETEVDPDDVAKIVFDLCEKMFQISEKYMKLSTKKVAGAMEQFEKNYRHLLPSTDLIVALTNSGTLLTIEECHHVYGRSLTIELESEQEWPLYPLLTY